MLHSRDFKNFSQEDIDSALSSLTNEELEELQYTWEFWARPNQLAPEGDWRVWLLNCGRGFGKTRTGAEWVREQVKLGYSRIAVVGPTKGSVRQVMVDGTSGLLSVCYDTDKTVNGVKVGKPVWSPTNNTVTWYNQDNGKKVAVAEVFSAEDPERLRGPQFERAWCFIADTKVLTPSGNKNVQSLEIGDRVLTSKGFQPIIGKSNRTMPVGTVSFSNGTTLTGTYEHPIWTQKGWIKLGQLTEGDKVCAIDVLNGVVSGGIPTITTTMSTEVQGQKVEKTERTFTERFMKPLTDLYQKVSMYTTLMVTSSIMTLPILKQCQERITCVCTGKKNPSHQQTTDCLNTPENVMIAEKKSQGTSKQIVVSAQTANKNVETTNVGHQGIVSTVEQNLNLYEEGSVVSVVSTWVEETEQTVYNIQVKNKSEYFANGILTHNCDEICAWTRRDETWDMLRFCMRLGTNPKIVVTTTPKPDRVIRSLVEPERLESGEVVLTLGSSYENEDNIDLTEIKAFEGTRLGRQEIHAEILTEAAGALWTKEMLERCEAYDIDDPVEFARENLKRVVVSVDPATTSNKHSDDTGIVVAGVDINGIAYVLEDATDKYTPEAWASKAIQLYDKYDADCLVAEKNQGGDLVRSTFKTVDETIPITLVHASKGKFARAEPVSALYEQGKVKHLRGLMELEDQMVTWEPLEAIGSPDRLDAMVWAIYTLLLKNRPKPKINILSNDAQSLSLF